MKLESLLWLPIHHALYAGKTAMKTTIRAGLHKCSNMRRALEWSAQAGLTSILQGKCQAAACLASLDHFLDARLLCNMSTVLCKATVGGQRVLGNMSACACLHVQDFDIPRQLPLHVGQQVTCRQCQLHQQEATCSDQTHSHTPLHVMTAPLQSAQRPYDSMVCPSNSNTAELAAVAC
jgi:hypothetical protein